MGGTFISLEVVVNPRKRGATLQKTIGSAVTSALEGWDRPDVRIEKGRYRNAFLVHEVTIWSEYDLDFETLQKIHQGLKKNEIIVAYTVTNMDQEFYHLHNHGITS